TDHFFVPFGSNAGAAIELTAKLAFGRRPDELARIHTSHVRNVFVGTSSKFRCCTWTNSSNGLFDRTRGSRLANEARHLFCSSSPRLGSRGSVLNSYCILHHPHLFCRVG